MAALTTEEFRGYAALAWKCGLISETQFDVLMAQYGKYVGMGFPEVVTAIERELRPTDGDATRTANSSSGRSSD